MSQENVEIIREIFRLFEARDRESWREYYDAGVIWDMSASGAPMSGIYRGHTGVERFFSDWLGIWDEYSLKVSELIDAGDSVVAIFQQRGRGKGSGVETERDFVGVYDLHQGKVSRYREYESRAEALEAVGLSE